MVIKGSARGGAAGLAAHLQRTDTNEVAELRELRGVAAEDLDGALHEMEAVASGARSARHFYHASINTRADEVMTMAQWHQAVDRLEQELGLTGQPRAVVAHVKEGRAHVHIAWSRINIETMRAIPDSHNFRRHEIVARELEREFGHARVQGAHIERAGEARPERTPSHAEMQQAERSGLTPQQAKQQLTEIWNRTDSGQAFAAAIAVEGWTLARGDKRDFVVLDPAGEVHSLGRRIDGTKAKDVRARMADVDAESLPTVEQAKALQRSHQQAAAEVAPPIRKQSAATRFEVFEALQQRQVREARMEEVSPTSGQVSEPPDHSDIQGADQRYRAALAQAFDDLDPYASLAQAALIEYQAFKKEQDGLAHTIEAAPDASTRSRFALRRAIEGNEYMAITTERLAEQSEVRSGSESNEEAQRLRMQAGRYREQSADLRTQYVNFPNHHGTRELPGDVSHQDDLGEGIAEIVERQRQHREAEDHTEGMTR